MTPAHTAAPQPEKGVRGFDIDIHINFVRPLPEAQAREVLRAFVGLRVELYRPHPRAMPAGYDASDEIPSARLTGPLTDADAVRAAIAAVLVQDARTLEVGLRGYLRSAGGQTEWMPWRKNVVLGRAEAAQLGFEEGVRYVLE